MDADVSESPMWNDNANADTDYYDVDDGNDNVDGTEGGYVDVCT